ncbi:MAG: GlcG/HbpS family heme-binding protein [Cellulosilyticaceae bacterium]
MMDKESCIQEVVQKVLQEYSMSQSQPAITREWANQVIEKIVHRATEHYGVSVVVGVTTKEGHPISIQCMDGAFLISYELVLKKCYTSVALKMPTHEVGKLLSKGSDLEGLEKMVDNKIIGLDGGYPILHRGGVIGAIAVSGATTTIDRELACFGAELFERR